LKELLTSILNNDMQARTLELSLVVHEQRSKHKHLEMRLFTWDIMARIKARLQAAHSLGDLLEVSGLLTVMQGKGISATAIKHATVALDKDHAVGALHLIGKRKLFCCPVASARL
jgi:hypothetical protein